MTPQTKTVRELVREAEAIPPNLDDPAIADVLRAIRAMRERLDSKA